MIGLFIVAVGLIALGAITVALIAAAAPRVRPLLAWLLVMIVGLGSYYGGNTAGRNLRASVLFGVQFHAIAPFARRVDELANAGACDELRSLVIRFDEITRHDRLDEDAATRARNELLSPAAEPAGRGT